MANTKETKLADKGLSLIASLWVEATIIIILCTSLSSLASQFIWGARVGFVVSILWAIYRCKKEAFKPELLSYKQGGWMLWTIIIGCFISLIVQPHCFLDSYSYRIPQMMFWIQEGHPWSVPNVDERINQMPHVWPMLSASFYSIFGEKGIALPNFISLLLFIWLLKDTAKNANVGDSLVNYVVTIFIAAPVVVMGASTNDNVITCTTFLFLSYFFACRTETTPKNISLSAISFALACGIKPQYLTLAPLWIGWFFLYGTKPYKQLKLSHYLYLIPLALICSPIPTLAVNQFYYGNYNLPEVTDASTYIFPDNTANSGRSFGKSIAILLQQLLDIPVNPLFNKLNSMLPKLGIEIISFSPLILAEGASLGLFAFIPLLWGLFKKKNIKYCSKCILPLCAIIALLLTTYITNAETLGRSFIGFFWLMLPFVFLGLAKCSKKLIIGFAIFSFLAGLACIVLDPSAPLWPAKTVPSKINHPTLKAQLEDYAHYSKRQYALTETISNLPSGVDTVGIIIQPGNPLAELWLNERDLKKIIPVGLNFSKEYIEQKNIEYLIIKLPILRNEEEAQEYINKIGAKVYAINTYTTYMQKGPEPWFLCKVKE